MGEPWQRRSKRSSGFMQDLTGDSGTFVFHFGRDEKPLEGLEPGSDIKGSP